MFIKEVHENYVVYLSDLNSYARNCTPPIDQTSILALPQFVAAWEAMPRATKDKWLRKFELGFSTINESSQRRIQELFGSKVARGVA